MVIGQSEYLAVEETASGSPDSPHVTFDKVVEDHGVKGINGPIAVGESHGSIEDPQKNRMCYATDDDLVDFQWDGELNQWVINIDGIVFLREYAAEMPEPVDIIIGKQVREEYLNYYSGLVDEDVEEEIARGDFVVPYERNNDTSGDEVQEQDI